MSGYNTYEARPADVKRAVEGMKALAGAPKEVQKRFEATEQAVYGWNGDEHDQDDFYRQTNPQYLQQNEGCKKFLGSLTDFLTGLQTATLESLHSIDRTSNAVQDEIGAAKVNAGNYTDGGHGKR
ncbi:hypothetical protein [Streptomyces sp. NBRC 110028]|uniref:hypothetical protein n=1 Tax=Streptomyces sp. NBRC 110028 TaxID=1621260 RepID=UPI000ADFD731|nr:hypothetical protein [Streptomyces sp. NBRC 110028]